MKRFFPAAAAMALFAAGAGAGDIPDAKLPLDKLLETPISTAAKHDQRLSSVAASVTVIGAEEIERHGWTTLAEVLQSVRGFYVTNDRTYSFIGVRGISRPTDYNERLLIMIDGMPVNDALFGKALAGDELAVDLATVEKIEIVRGPGSALYGGHAMLAVINIVTKSADETDGVGVSLLRGSQQKKGASLRLGNVFANGLQLTASVLWQELNGNDVYIPEFDSPATNGGIAHHLDYEDLHSVVVGLRKGDFRITASSRSATTGVPTAEYATRFNADSSVRNVENRVEAEAHRTVGIGKTLEVRGYWDRATYRGRWPYDDLGVDRYLAQQIGGEARLHWDIRPNQRLTIGSELAKASRIEYQYVVGDFHVDLVRPYDAKSTYVQYEYHPSPIFGLVAGVRRDDDSGIAGATSPRAGLLYTPTSGTTVKLLYGSAFRAPNIYETYYADSLTPWKANPALKPETIRTVELVWEQRLSPQTFLTTSAYHIGASGLIDQQLDPVDSIYQYQNLGSLRSNGVELGLQMRTAAGVWGSASWTMQKASDAGSAMTNSPQHLLKVRLSTSPAALYQAGIDAEWESERLTRGGATTDAFLLLNASLSRQIAGHLRLNLLIRNLLDTTYSNPVGPELLPQSIRQDRRTLALKLTYTR